MPYCSQCGVEVDNTIDTCSLCKTPIQKLASGDEEIELKYPERKIKVPVTNKQIRLILWTTLSILLITSFLIVLAINLLKDGAITWSGYGMTSIGGAWIYCALLLFFIRRPSVVIAGNFIATSGLLSLIDIIDGSLDWFLVLGLPIAGAVTLVSIIIVLAVKFSRERGANIIGLTFSLATILCIGIDLLVSGYGGNVSMSWSFIVLAAVCPIAFFMFYYHYNLRKRYDITKIFHV